MSSSSKSTTSSSLKTGISISTAARSERSYPATRKFHEKWMVLFSLELVHAIELVLTLNSAHYNKNISKFFRSKLKHLKIYISGIHSKREQSSSTTQSMSSKRSSYNPVLPKKRMENGSDSMQQFNRLTSGLNYRETSYKNNFREV